MTSTGIHARNRVLAIIPARGGSKGVPGKNVRPLGGRPLIAWTIAAAREAACIHHAVVSSDDDRVLRIAQQWGAPAIARRPAHLATDEADVMETILHLLDQVEDAYDHVVLLQPTSPLRTAADIDAAFALYRHSGAPACVSVAPAPKSPYRMYELDDGRRLRPLLEPREAARRQDLPPVHVLNGAIYIAGIPWLRRTRAFLTDETVAYLMPAERSVDIDTELDFALAETILQRWPSASGRAAVR